MKILRSENLSMFDLMGGGFGPLTGKTWYAATRTTKAWDFLVSRVPAGRLFPTIQECVEVAEAGRGDRIIVGSEHVETVASAGALDLDKANLDLLGIGQGSDRPQINFTTAVTADMDIDAANISMRNFLLTGGVDNITAMVDVNAADFTMVDCEIRDVTGQMALGILTDANADRMKLIRPVFNLASAAGGAAAIRLVGGDDIEIVSPNIYGNFSAAAINILTTAAVRLKIFGTAERPGFIWTENANDLCIEDEVTGSTGQMGPHLYLTLQDDAANITTAITGATFHLFDPVYVVNAVNEKAMLIDWTASTNA